MKQIETLRDYIQAAMTTCTQPQCKNTRYMQLGLLGEIGELANKVKKTIRNENGEAEQAEQGIAGELGDVMWYCAGILSCTGEADNINGASLDDMDTYRQEEDYPGALKNQDEIHLLQTMAFATCGTPMPITVIGCVIELSHRHGTTLTEVCRQNIAKLADRYGRDKIGGEGDER